jgi:hypothetical protein
MPVTIPATYQPTYRPKIAGGGSGKIAGTVGVPSGRARRAPRFPAFTRGVKLPNCSTETGRAGRKAGGLKLRPGGPNGHPAGPAFRRPPRGAPSGPSRFPQHTDSITYYFRIRGAAGAPRVPRGHHGWHLWRGFPEDCRAALGKTLGICRCEGSIRSLKSNKSKRISAIRGAAARNRRQEASAAGSRSRPEECLGDPPGPPGLPKLRSLRRWPKSSLLPTYLPIDLPTNLVTRKTPDFAIFAEFGAPLVPSEPPQYPSGATLRSRNSAVRMVRKRYISGHSGGKD